MQPPTPDPGRPANSFDMEIIRATGGCLGALDTETLQINVGLLCNQACTHCHLQAGPRRAEMMGWRTMEILAELSDTLGCDKVDITGGAPELHPRLREFLSELGRRDKHVMLRTNLTVLLEPGQEDLPELFRDQGIDLIASLPCYLEEEVTEQRGEGVFDTSLETLRRLNELGYGEPGGPPLDLVYNPLGAFLPPPQKDLEAEYRKELGEAYGITFTQLFTIANMPIGRFEQDLRRKGEFEGYMELLRSSFNPQTIQSLMCRHQINVGWDGTICDCDFNRAIGLESSFSLTRDLDRGSLEARRIETGEHCYGCTAGSGSSCGGALLE